MEPVLSYRHVDVFAKLPFSGNSLVVFPDSLGLTAEQMLEITQELRHFEAIFLERSSDAFTVRARIFDLVEELPFAGHPVIGAAAVLHEAASAQPTARWTFELAERTVTVDTRRTQDGYYSLLDQGAAQFCGEVSEREAFAKAFSLTLDDLDPSLPLAVVSTGLRYLIVPVRHGHLAGARIASDLTPLVRSVGAQFAVLLDDAALEVRHWNNDGIVEDIATGSAAGTIGAYRLRYGRAPSGMAFALNQGRFVGRPSELMVEPHGKGDEVGSVRVGGDVAIVGRGSLEVLPSAGSIADLPLEVAHER